MSGYHTIAVCVVCLGIAITVVSWMAWRADR